MWCSIDPIIYAQKASGRARPRVWICPTGAFGFFPLHAAGTYSTLSSECCSDYFVASYTPTLRALINARTGPELPIVSQARALVAAVPHPYQGPKLSAVADEAAALLQVIPPESLVPLCVNRGHNERASTGLTVQLVLDHVRDAAILHLASHGVQVCNLFHPHASQL
jgi:hypothetical protein